jgi:lipoprotein NlpI
LYTIDLFYFILKGLALKELGESDAAMEAFSYVLKLDANHVDTR